MSIESAPLFRAALLPRRMPLDLPCVLHFPDRDLEARTYDICYGGIGLLLPEATPEFSPASLRAVSVEALGEVLLDMRWRRMHRIGAAFAEEDAVQGQLARFFRDIGSYPESAL